MPGGGGADHALVDDWTGESVENRGKTGRKRGEVEMTCRERLEQLFREQGGKDKATPHPEVYTAQEVAAVEHVSGYAMAKTVAVSADGKLVLVVLPAPHRVDITKVKRALGAEEVRLAKEEEFSRVFPDCEVGAMPPFGSLYGVPVPVDRTLTPDPENA